MIIFFTGTYDEQIKKVIGNFKTKSLKSKYGIDIPLDELLFDNTNVPQSIRTYHPGYIRRVKYDDIMVEIIKNIISNRLNA